MSQLFTFNAIQHKQLEYESLTDKLFQELAKEVQHTIRYTALSLSVEDVDDIASDVWLNVHQKIHTYDPTLSHIRTWVKQIARNKTIDFLRKMSAKKRNGRSVSLDNDPIESTSEDFSAIAMEHLPDHQSINPEDIFVNPDRQYFALALAQMWHQAKSRPDGQARISAVARLEKWIEYLEYEPLLTHEQIAHELSRIEGREVTKKAVERAFARYRERFIELYEEERHKDQAQT